MSHFRPWESSTANNSQANQRRNAHSLQANQQKSDKNSLLDDYVNTKHLQVVARLASLMHFKGSVAQQLHRYYIESFTQLQSSSSCTSSHQPTELQQTRTPTSKQQYEDLFFIINRQCEVLEEHMQEFIKNGITGAPCTSTGGASGDGVLDLSPASDSWRAADNVPHAHTVLNYWYESNKHDPYPTNREALQLGRKCGMKVAQVKKWMSNKRTRCHNTRRQLKPAQKTVK